MVRGSAFHRKLYLAIVDDTHHWDSIQEDMTRLAVGIKDAVIKEERQMKAKKAAEAEGLEGEVAISI